MSGQLNVIDVLPGDQGYNDFWQVMKVTVPAGYVANTVTSVAEIGAQGFPVEATDMLVNCPVVPKGSSAALRLKDEPDRPHAGLVPRQGRLLLELFRSVAHGDGRRSTDCRPSS